MDALNEAKEALTWVDGSGTDDVFLAKAQAFATVAQAENASFQAHSLERMAESMERALPMLSNIAMQLGNIHQALIAPGVDGSPINVADVLSVAAGVLKEMATDVSGIAMKPTR